MMIVYWLVYLFIFCAVVAAVVSVLPLLRRTPCVYAGLSLVLAAAYFLVYSFQADVGVSLGSFRGFIRPSFIVLGVSMTITGIAATFSKDTVGSRRLFASVGVIWSAGVLVTSLLVSFKWKW